MNHADFNLYYSKQTNNGYVVLSMLNANISPLFYFSNSELLAENGWAVKATTGRLTIDVAAQEVLLPIGRSSDFTEIHTKDPIYVGTEISELLLEWSENPWQIEEPLYHRELLTHSSTMNQGLSVRLYDASRKAAGTQFVIVEVPLNISVLLLKREQLGQAEDSKVLSIDGKLPMCSLLVKSLDKLTALSQDSQGAVGQPLVIENFMCFEFETGAWAFAKACSRELCNLADSVYESWEGVSVPYPAEVD